MPTSSDRTKSGPSFRALCLGLWAAALIAALLALAATLFGKPVWVSFIDVGQGDACLIQGGRGGTVLLDGGDQGEGRTLADFLEDRNVRALDGIFLSHFHADHVTGVVELLEAGFPVGCLWAPDVQSGTEPEKQLLQIARERDIPIRRLKQGDSLQLGKLSYQVLWPGEVEPGTDLNNSSLVLRAQYGSVSLLFTGDLETSGAEKLMAEQGASLKTDILKVPHHGGASSVSLPFLAACAPQWAVISVGVRNNYKDPSREMLAALALEHIQVWRTDRDGTVTVTLGKNKVKQINRANKWR